MAVPGTTPWRILLLGGLRVERGEVVFTRFKSQKVGGLLAYLACHLRQAHPREVLLDIFWPELSMEAGRNNLSVGLSSLRNQLEPPGTTSGSVLRADRFSVSLNPAAVTTDVEEFEEALRSAAISDSKTARRQHLERAVGLYQGPLLPGFYEEWVLSEQERLSGLYFDAASQLIASLHAQGDLPSALRYARQAVFLDPLREEACRHLMSILAETGQLGAALRQYREFERRLEQELGEEPSAPLRALYRQVQRQAEGEEPSGITRRAALPGPEEATAEARRVPEPVGPQTLTFLMTDIESSTRQWEQAGDDYKRALQRHDSLLRQEFLRFGGQEIRSLGDGFLSAFPSARQALLCAVACQQALSEAGGAPENLAADARLPPLRVRMALHTGDVEFRDGNWEGLVLHHTSRILTAGHGGQILCSEALAGVVRRFLPDEVRLVDLGVWRLRDVALPERLFQVEYPGLEQTTFPALNAQSGQQQAHLPLQFTRFFGREQELAQLAERLTPPAPARLLTLTGPGGTGKTRLAIAAAEQMADAYEGRVWFVALADLSDPDRVADAVLDALPLTRLPHREPLEQVIDFLQAQGTKASAAPVSVSPASSLLLLDNFEHLVEGGAEIVKSLLEQVPGLACLVTSRRLLGLAGEQEFVVSPLPTPNGPDTPEHLSLYDSVRLFVDRAQAVMPHFQVTSHNAPAVAELCNRLEGIPLAIELAAARVQVLTPAQMLQQLAHRFEFLSSRRRDVSERQKTLRGAIDWSYRLLAPELQRFFVRLSVFRGGWTIEAAETVCEEPLALDYLAQLRDASLVQAQETDSGMRFSMLETLREFGLEQATPDECARRERAHAQYYLPESSRVMTSVKTRTDAETRFVRQRWFDAERANLLAAMTWCYEKSGEHAELLAQGAMIYSIYGIWRGYFREGVIWLNRAVEATVGLRTKRRAGLLIRAAQANSNVGDDETARGYLIECLEISGEINDNLVRADALASLGGLVARAGDQPAEAQRLLEEAVALQREVGSVSDLGMVLCQLARVQLNLADVEECLRNASEAHALAQESGDYLLKVWTAWLLGEVALVQGNLAAARPAFVEALTLACEWQDQRYIAWSLQRFACLFAERGDTERAVKCQAASEAILEEMGLPTALPPNLAPSYLRVREVLSEDNYNTAREAGRTMGWEQAVALALDESSSN